MEVDERRLDIVRSAFVLSRVLAIGGLPDGDHGDDGHLVVLLLHREVGRLSVQETDAVTVPKHHL